MDFTEMAKLVVRSGGIVELVIGFWKANYWEAKFDTDILSCGFVYFNQYNLLVFIPGGWSTDCVYTAHSFA